MKILGFLALIPAIVVITFIAGLFYHDDVLPDNAFQDSVGGIFVRGFLLILILGAITLVCFGFFSLTVWGISILGS